MVYIIIPVFNRWHFTKDCIESLLNQTCKDFTIVIVDHGSTDGTRERIKNEFPSVTLLLGDETMWWTAATNVGVNWVLEKCTLNDYILTLNNDLVVNADYLKKLIDTAFLNNNSLVGSVSVDIKNEQQICFAGVQWNRFTAKYNLKNYKIDSGVECLPTDLLPGRGTLVPIKAFMAVGIYDELNFPHYAADEDFSLRCKKKGYDLLISTKAIVRSHIDATGLNKTNTSNLKKFIINFYSIKSPNNLFKRWIWARKHSPLPVFYFLLDTGRIIISSTRMIFNTKL